MKPLFPEPEAPEPKDPDDAPLADRMRPRTLEEVLGQDHLLGEGRFLREAIRADKPPSMILWGPPGVGKTTLARLIARHTRSHFVSLSAVLSGVKDVEQTRNDPVPLHLRNAPTRLMKEFGYGEGYRYAHDDAQATFEMPCLPESLAGRRYFEPKGVGFEAEIKKRLEELRKGKG